MLAAPDHTGDEHAISVDDVIRQLSVVYRYLWLVVLLAVVGGLATWWTTSSDLPQFSASTKMLLQEGRGFSFSAIGNVQASSDTARTYRELLITRPVLQRAAEFLGAGTSAEQLGAAINVSGIAGTKFIVITATTDDPVRSANFANGLAASFIDQTAQDRLASVTQIEQLAAAQGSGELDEFAAALLTALDSLTIVDRAVPQIRSATNSPSLKIVAGTMLSAILGIVASFVINMFRDPIQPATRLRQILNASVVGSIPNSNRARDPANFSMTPGNDPFDESFRFLRVGLDFMQMAKPGTSLIVTSAEQSAGKSTVAMGLASAISAAGHNVLLIDGDMRGGYLTTRLMGEIQGSAGLSVLLAAGDDKFRSHITRPHDNGIDFLPCGPIPPNPAELLGFANLAKVVEYGTSSGAVVIIDSPPALAVVDASIVAPTVGGVVLVADASRTKQRHLSRAVDQFRQAGVHNIGVVVNNVRSRRFGQYNGYGSYRHSLYHGTKKSEKDSRLRGRIANAVRPWKRSKSKDQ